MNSTFLPSSYLPFPRTLCRSRHNLQFRPLHNCLYRQCSDGRQSSYLSSRLQFASPRLMCNLQHSQSATSPLDEGTIPVIHFEDFIEKEWSFLETDATNSDEEHRQKTDRIISAGEIGEASRILISTGSEEFVDRVVESSSYEELLVVHDSLLTLACIKEKYDKVKCWQGELIYVPEKWAPFDVVFLYFLPALPFELSQVFGTLAKHCLPGARVVISHLQGRQVLEGQRRQYPDVVVSSLPDKTTLLNVATSYSFRVAEFMDERDVYLAVLNFKGKTAE